MFKVKNPNFKERIENYLDRQMFMKLAGMEITSIAPGQVEVVLEITEDHEQQFGRIHGGAISTIADIASGFAAYTLVSDQQHVVTGELKVSYYSGGRGGILRSIGKVMKAGSKISFCESEVFHEKDGITKLIAKASTSMVIIPIGQE